MTQLLQSAKNEHAGLEEQRTELARKAIQAQSMEDELDRLGSALFPRATADATMLALMHEVDTLLLLAKLVPTEVTREKRARTALIAAEKSGKAVLQIMRDILQMSIQLGMANDNRDRLFPGQPSTLTKRSMPLFLRAKTRLGDFYTNIAKARMRQRFVEKAPIMDIADLTRLPGKKNNPLDRDGMQRSIETSYTQCQHVCAYSHAEIRISREREKALGQYESELDECIREAQWRVRKAQAYALEESGPALHEALSKLVAELPPDDAEPRARVPLRPPESPVADDDDARSSAGTVITGITGLSLATSATAVSIVGASPELYARALQRLHTKLASINEACRTDDNDEDLPWHPGALGF